MNLAGIEREVRRLQERQGAGDPAVAAVLRDAEQDPAFVAACAQHKELLNKVLADPGAEVSYEEMEVLFDLRDLHRAACLRLASERGLSVELLDAGGRS
ncbi:MAG: hypothetical protein WAW99_03840 [Candidatus Bipolaricaulis anaerobius]